VERPTSRLPYPSPSRPRQSAEQTEEQEQIANANALISKVTLRRIDLPEKRFPTSFPAKARDSNIGVNVSSATCCDLAFGDGVDEFTNVDLTP